MRRRTPAVRTRAYAHRIYFVIAPAFGVWLRKGLQALDRGSLALPNAHSVAIVAGAPAQLQHAPAATAVAFCENDLPGPPPARLRNEQRKKKGSRAARPHSCCGCNRCLLKFSHHAKTGDSRDGVVLPDGNAKAVGGGGRRGNGEEYIHILPVTHILPC